MKDDQIGVTYSKTEGNKKCMHNFYHMSNKEVLWEAWAHVEG